jgi:hypothetical protein
MNLTVRCAACSTVVAVQDVPEIQRVSCPHCGALVYPHPSGYHARSAQHPSDRSTSPYHPLERPQLTPEEKNRARCLLASVDGF